MAESTNSRAPKMRITVVSTLADAVPLILKYAIDHGIMQKDVSALGRAAAGFSAIVILNYLARSSQSISAAVAVHRMVRRLRMKLFGHVLSLNASYHDRSMASINAGATENLLSIYYAVAANQSPPT